jgi:hypothetical protein
MREDRGMGDYVELRDVERLLVADAAELEHYRVQGAYERGQRDAIQNDGRTNPYPDGNESNRLWAAGFASIK